MFTLLFGYRVFESAALPPPDGIPFEPLAQPDRTKPAPITQRLVPAPAVVLAPREIRWAAYYLIDRSQHDAVFGSRRTHINADRRHRKHPNQRDVSLYRSRRFTLSGPTGRTCGRCTCTHSPRRWNCVFSLHTITSSAFLNVFQISWGGCGSFVVNSTDPNLQCGSLDVPMDYHDSSAGTARLAVIKYAATAPKKLGTIFLNPGDPLRPSFMTFR